MPVLRCPECGVVVAWAGKSLGFRCPGEHPDRHPWRLDVDRDLIHRNGHGIDVHLTGADRRERAAESYAGSMDWVAVNRAKGRRTG